MKFLELIHNYKIEIPLIQRDYVQGLDYKKASKFLEAIKNGMNDGLNLDFIYGNKNKEKFIPIDGQQRLTTLFLIYYYLSLESNYIEELSKFSYAIRPSSKDFISELTNKDNWQKLSKNNIKRQIKNSNWYFLSWENDLTIKSMLEMLDLIENTFKYSDINDLEKIDFHFLDLDEYSLGEDLYIKMNARGKQLSDFENFKAEFENFIKDPKIKAKLDNEWLDIFWKLNYQKVDEYYYNFFFNTSFNFYVENYTIDKDFLKQKEIFDFYEDIYPEYLNHIITILDNLQTYSNLKEFCEIKKEAKYYERLYFYVWSLGILKKFDSIQMDRWQRICKNLIENIRIEDPESFQDILKEIKKLNNPILKDVYQEIDFENIGKFSSEQIKEEKLKIELILSNLHWEQEFIKAEENWYLNGQIEFLLNYSNNNFDKFIEYRDKFINLWDLAKNNKYNQTLIQRALLTIEDYKIQHNNWHKYTFCSFETRLRIKTENWRRVFGKECFKTLLDNFNNKNDLINLIDNYQFNCDDFKSYFINPKQNWSVLEETKNYQIIFENDKTIFLNAGGTTPDKWGWKRKKELYSFYFFKKYIEHLNLLPFENNWYFDSSSQHPCAVIDNYKNYAIDVYFDNGFEIYFYKKKNDNLIKITNIHIIDILNNYSFEKIDKQFKFKNKFSLCQIKNLNKFLEDFTSQLT